MERERPKHGKHTQATATMTMMKTTYSLSTLLILLLHTISTYAQTETENVALENLGTFRSNQTTWTVAWREPATPSISKYGVYYHMTSDAADSAVKVDDIVSRGPKYFYKVPISHLVPNTNYTVIIQPCGETSCYANITYNGRTTPCCGRSQLQVHITYPGMSCAQQGILQTKIRSHIAYPLQARWRQGFCGRSCDQTNRLLLNRCPINAVLANITFPYAREEFQLYDPASGGASAKMSSIDAIRYDLVKNKAFDFSSDSTLIGGKPDIDNVIIMKTYTGCGATAPMMDTCIGCGPGYYVVGAPHKRLGCLACEKGSYQPENHKRHCIPCPADAKGRLATTLHTASKQETQCFFSAAVDGISPAYGPKAGGTVVKIAMVYFKADQLKSVTVAGSPCAVIPGSVSDLGLDCKTSAVNRLSSGPVIVDLGETQVASDTVFHYKNNPDIDSVDFLNTFISGGVVLTVHGSFMDAVAEPIMQITRKIKEHKEIYSVVCVVNDEFSFSCETPNMTQGFENLSDIKLPSADSARNRTRKSRSLHTYSEPNNAHDLTRRSQVTNVNFTQSLDKLDPRIKFAISGFVLDGVSTYSNFTAVKAQYSRLAVYADPIIYKFPGEQYLRVFKTGRQDLLQIEGERLNLGCRPEDYRVQIGLANCTVSVLTTRLLGCKPPFEKPESDPSVYWQDYPHVQVQVGRLSFLAGYVEYQLITCKLGVFCDIKVAGAVIGLAALFLTIVAVACVCTLKRRRRPRSRPKRDNSQPPALGTGEVHYRPDTLPKDRGKVNSSGAGNRITRYSRISEEEEESRANRDSELMKRGSRISVGSNRNSLVENSGRPVTRARAPSATEDFTITLPRDATPPSDTNPQQAQPQPQQGRRKSSLVQKLPAIEQKDTPPLATKLPKRNSQDEGAPVVKRKEKHKRKDKRESKAKSESQNDRAGGARDPQNIPVSGNIDLASVFPKAKQSPTLPAKSHPDMQTNLRRNKKRPESEAKR